MKVVILSCSPRKGGNCDILTSAVGRLISGAEVYYSRDIECSPCDGCGYCEKAGVCKHGDGAVALYEKLLAADAILVIAPVYFYSFDAHTKAIIDRAQYLWHKVKDRRIPLYLIACGGQSGENNFTYIQKVLVSWGMAIGGDYKAGLFFPSTDAVGDILRGGGVERACIAVQDWGLRQ